MNATPEEYIADISFPPGSFVHPTRRPGHVAHVLMTVAPGVGRPPMLGYTYAVILCPQFSLPAEFPFMTEEQQEAIIRRLEAVQTIRTDTLTAVENVGLKLISDEWIVSHTPEPASDDPENTGSGTETGARVIIP